MTEVVANKVGGAEPGPYRQLLALSSIADAEKLTLEMIKETAEWPKLWPEGVKSAEVVRHCWLRQIKKVFGEEDANDLGRRWAHAFGKQNAAASPRS